MTAGLFLKKKSLLSEIENSNEMNRNDTINSSPIIIPENSFMDGSFSSKISIRIEGGFTGLLYSKDKVIIDDVGIVQGNIIASEIVIIGKVIGNIYCFGKVHVKNGGKMEGNIFTNRFQNDEGSDLNSNITILNHETLIKLEEINNNIILQLGVNTNTYFEDLIRFFSNETSKK